MKALSKIGVLMALSGAALVSAGVSRFSYTQIVRGSPLGTVRFGPATGRSWTTRRSCPRAKCCPPTARCTELAPSQRGRSARTRSTTSETSPHGGTVAPSADARVTSHA